MYGYGNSMFLATHGILARSASGGAVDPDAQAFITAASITDPTQQSAINTLVTDLKGYSIWSKMKALYPFVGGTASTHKWNLKDPRDLDAAFRLVFNGGWTHSNNGATPNGTNAYADTFLDSYFGPTGSPLPYISQTDISFGVYSRTNNIVAGADISGGRMLGTFTEQTLYLKNTDNNTYWAVSDYILNGNANIISDTRGLINVSRINNTNKKIYRNGSLISTYNGAADTYQGVACKFAIGARSNASGISAYSNRQYAFAYISNGLTDTEAANFYTAVQAFQTTLGRSIGTQTVSDADAQAFVTNAGIVDQVEANAINNLVIGLKADSLWTKMKAVYPMVGGSSSTMKYNLKNPLDTDAAFRLVFNGGWTFSSQGALPNGTNAYADTKFAPSANLSSYNIHLSYYSRTDNLANTTVDVGSIDGSSNFMHMHLRYTGDIWYALLQQNALDSVSNSSSLGYFIGNRTSSTIKKQFRNGANLGTITTSATASLNNRNIYFGALNNNLTASNFSAKQTAFASIGDGLTDTDATNLNTRVTTFQTSLNRNV